MDNNVIYIEEATVECVTTEEIQEMSCNPGPTPCLPS